VLLLDEPTNDLDIDTLTVLEDYLETFPGAVVAVSHDRYFLDKVAGRTFLVDGKGGVTETAGGYTAWLESAGAEGTTNLAEGKTTNAAIPKKEKPKGKEKLKFSYMEQREFETIEGDIAKLEEELAGVMAEQERQASDYVALGKLQEKQTELEAKLEEKMDRWVYLTDLNERIQAQREEGQ
jgi:ATP-binding cassette subfamily F protein uup